MSIKNQQQKTQGKIDPQKYVYQEKKRHNRHQEIRLSGVPPIMPIKNQQQKTQGK